MHASDQWFIVAMYLAVGLLIGVALLGSRLKPSTRRSIERYVFGPALLVGYVGLSTYFAWRHEWWRVGFWLAMGALQLWFGLIARKRRLQEVLDVGPAPKGPAK